MKKPSSLVTLCVLVTFVLAFQVSPSMADTDREDICTWNFEATVRQGPHAGESFAGTLTVVIAKHGTLTGVLVTDAPETILVVGQVNGRAVNLAVALQEIDQETEGLYLFGTGTARLPITSKTQCGGVMGGTFAGPYPGDIGDWLVCIGVRTSGGTCIGVSF